MIHEDRTKSGIYELRLLGTISRPSHLAPWLLAVFLAAPGSVLAADGGTSNAQATYYVSPQGSDCNPGTLVAPLRTLSKARDVVRTVNSAMTGDIVVYLRGGTYPLTSTLSFAAADSGSKGFYVKYLNYPSETPLLTGGQPIGGWTLSGSAKNIWQATGVTSRFRQLYVNGTKAIRARTPNLGTGGTANFNRITGADQTVPNVQVASSQVANWNNLTKVEMHLMINWGDATLRLASYSTTGATAFLKFQSPEAGILSQRPFPILASVKQAYYFENAFEFLDAPGEWYLNETTNTLYYQPRTGEDMTTATVVAPMVETLVSVMGTSADTSPAHHIWFQGLAFAHSTYLRPSSFGFLDGQAGQYNVSATAQNQQYVGRPAAGVLVANANNIWFERNIFSQMAATGLDFNYGTHDDTIVGNVFTDIGGAGVSVGKFVQDETTEFHIAYNPSNASEICTNDTIKDNYITHVTTEIQGACGIACGYPRTIDIEHNEVSDVNYTGISVGFGWTATANAMSGNRINYNDIHDIVKILADGGGIYTLSNQGSGSQMEYNYIHDFQKSQWADYGDHGLYLDEQTSGYAVSHNVLVNCPAISTNHPGTNTMSDNAGSLASTISGAGIEPAYVDIKKNLTIPIPAFASSSGGTTGACGSTSGAGGTGGATGAGGSTGSGGSRNSGGAVATGGATNSGGAPGTAGTTRIGGTTGASGGTSAGGTTGAGGGTSAGGTASAGGTTGASSATGAGGTTGVGGVMSTGGTTDSGSAAATGGATNTGGATSTGGAAATGGLTSTGGASVTGSSTNMGGSINPAGAAGATESSRNSTSATASGCSCRLGGNAANPSSRDFGFVLLGLAWVGLHRLRRGANIIGANHDSLGT
jgi:MYXO-CTERM domain-containing protein